MLRCKACQPTALEPEKYWWAGSVTAFPEALHFIIETVIWESCFLSGTGAGCRDPGGRGWWSRSGYFFGYVGHCFTISLPYTKVSVCSPSPVSPSVRVSLCSPFLPHIFFHFFLLEELLKESGCWEELLVQEKGQLLTGCYFISSVTLRSVGFDITT